MSASPLDVIADWPVKNAAAAVVRPGGVAAQYGDVARRFALASVTKPLVARAAQVAIEEGAIDLDTPAGPPGSTVRHLLAHASGLSMNGGDSVNEPGSRRVYSNYGFQVLAESIEQASDIAFADYLRDGVFAPLGMTGSGLEGGAEGAGYGAYSTVADLARFAGDLLRPRLVSDGMHRESVSVQFPGLDGVLPGFGMQRPNDWGLGVELRGGKSPHWTGARNSSGTYGHFGQSGTFVWVDPERDMALIALTDRAFGDWSKGCWPKISDTVIEEFGAD